MDVLLSIKPKYADKIFSGEKHFEYRRVVWQNEDVGKVILYASAPVKMVVGELIISPFRRNKGLIIETIWRLTAPYSGVEASAFFKYFLGKNRGHALRIESYKKYDTPKPLSDYGIKRPPQNFMYLR